MERPEVMIVDDTPEFLELLRVYLTDNGYNVRCARSVTEALEKLRQKKCEIVICGMFMPEMNGTQLLKRVKELWPEIEVVITGGNGSIRQAVELLKLGACDYLTKPVSLEVLLKSIQRIEKVRTICIEKEDPRLPEKYMRYGIVGRDKKILRIYSQIESASRVDFPVLVRGDTGTGKELVACAIHNQSSRREEPLVAVNCAAIPEGLLETELFGHKKGAFTGAIAEKKGKFEIADRGTLFLDEIGDMSLHMQAKLLRVLERGEFERVGGTKPVKLDVRLIAATNKDLKAEIEKGNFRDDLYFRINVITINLPALRERKGDISLLTEHFLQIYSERTGKKILEIAEDALEVLMGYYWPGNVRELENSLKRAVVSAEGPKIQIKDIPDEIRDLYTNDTGKGNLCLAEAVQQFERGFIEEALSQSQGNVSATARILRIHRKNLQMKINRYSIKVNRFRQV